MRLSKIGILVLCLWALTAWADSGKLVKQEVAKSISMLVSEDLTRLEGALPPRMFTAHKPLAAYTAAGREVDLTLNLARTVWDPKDTQILLDFYKANATQAYTSVRWHKSEVQTINGRKFAILEFLGEVREKHKNPLKRYHYNAYTVDKGYVLVFAFSCPTVEQPTWEPIVPRMMASIKIAR